MGRVLTINDVEYAVKGGSIYACGGGGWAEHGLEIGGLAVRIGRTELISIEELADNDWVATSAAIGAPGDLTDWEILVWIMCGRCN